MAIKAFVFDCFGVLYNDAFKDFLQRNAVAIGDRVPYFYELCNASDAGELDDATFYGTLAQVSGEDPAQLKTEFHDTRHLNRGLTQLITRLKPRYKIGMLSNSGRALLDEFMAEHGIAHLFDVVVASADTSYVKPQREIFELLAQRLGLAMDEIYFVDDSPANITAAQSYGMQGHTYATVADLERALLNYL